MLGASASVTFGVTLGVILGVTLGGAGKFAAEEFSGEFFGFRADSDARFRDLSMARSAPRSTLRLGGSPAGEWPGEGRADGGAYGVAGFGVALSLVNDGGGGGVTWVMN